MELEQLEALALAADRSEALAQLIPGTEDYYFHHCLEHLHRGEFEQTKPLFDAWVKRHGETTRVNELRDRHAVLTLASEPSSSREYLRRRLGLSFHHQREIEGTRSDLPTRLYPEWIDREVFFRDAVAHRDDLQGFHSRAHEWLVERELSPTQLRALLTRLTRPDYTNIVALVLRELDDKHSSGFGSLPIHRMLLARQLDALAAARPSLRKNSSFIETRLARLRPGPDVDLDHDAAAMSAHLDALAAFVKPLTLAFAGLQAHVLYHRLDFDRRRGVYDRARFDQYLALPRQVDYLAANFRQRHRDDLAQLDQDFSSATGLPAVGRDEPLVRDYLATFFASPQLDDYDAFKTTIDEDYLRKLFAETKILAGLGDPERWYSLLDSPSYYQELEQRVEIELALQNPKVFAAGDPVELIVDVKNVQSLVVKVFEIDPLAYFLAHGRAVDTGVDLDGLVANDERVIEYAEPALRRVRRTLKFESLAGPGTYVVELIGKGKSSRALIRKGGLRYVERLGAAGHVLTILDEDDRRVADASVWFAGREIRPDSSGDIRIPYAGSPSNVQILLRADRVSSIVPLQLQTESYGFRVGVHVEREQLIAGAMADLIVRATLSVNGVAISPSLLRETTLTIRSTDRHGTSSSLTVPIEPTREAEVVHAFKVPEALHGLAFEVRAKVRSVTGQRDVELGAHDSLTLNEIDLGDELAALHLVPSAAGYVLYLLGKSGEPRAGMQVNVALEHLDFVSRRQFALQTDARGRIELGELRDIAVIEAAFAGGRGRWVLTRADASLPNLIHVAADQPLVLPQPHELGTDVVAAISLLELRGQGFLRDCIDAVTLEPGGLRVHGLTPGDYLLSFKHAGPSIRLSVGAAKVEAGFALSARRHLQLSRPSAGREPLRITTLELDDQHLRVRVAGAGKTTRVHVFASRFWPSTDARSGLDRHGENSPSAITVGRARSHYLSGRDIGDEYRYILERKRAPRLAGNLAERPSLLLNPWAIRTTSSGIQQAASGSAYASEAESSRRSAMVGAPSAKPMVQPTGGSPNLDFLATPAFVALDLALDDQGFVVIDRASLAHAHLVRIVAANPTQMVSRQLRLAEVDVASRDLRLLDALPIDGHFIQRKQASALAPGDALVIEDMRTSKLELIDSLAKAHALLLTLSGDAALREFEFVTRWPSLTPEEQRERYSKYACHELHLLLARKDPAFFGEVVRPYLANKRDKTFLDHYLLGDDLSRWREPWAFGQLNTLERILLLGRASARHVGDRCDLIPPDVVGDNAAFDAAMEGGALQAETFGFQAGGPRGSGGEGGAPMLPGSPPSLGGPPQASMPPPAPAAAPAPSRKRALKRGEADMEKEMLAAADEPSPMELDDDYDGGDLDAREQTRRFYQSTDKTEEWAENNYYRRRIHDQGPALIGVNAFWRDFANHDGTTPFSSRHFVRATSCFAEMLCALAVLDLPFTATPPSSEFEQAKLRLRASTPLLVFTKQIAATTPDEHGIGVLVSQSYFRADDRYRYENNEQHDKYVGDELLVHVRYVCRVVLTNPSSSSHKLDLLVQIPRGAMPVGNGFQTRDLHVQLPPHGTHAIEYAFYFPVPGRFEHFPVHVAKNEALVVFAAPTTLTVVTRLSSVDTESWSHVSQHADDDALLRYLDVNNIDRLELGRIAWRMGQRPMFLATLELLARRHVYADVLWSYALHHFGDVAPADPEVSAALGVYLRQHPSFLRQCGLALDSAVVASDPVARRWYEHLEYAPLVNARAHQLGAKRTILNSALADHYRSFLTTLIYVAKPSADHLVAAAGYALAQDRVADALMLLARIDPAQITGALQFDYLRAYLAISQEDASSARELAERHREHRVDRWRRRFANLLAILDEAEGAAAKLVDADDRQQAQAQLAASEPNIEFTVDGSVITLSYQHLRECVVRFYRMDIELLFSRQPFMADPSARFSIVQPNHSERLELAADAIQQRLELPLAYRSSNTIIEVLGGGIRRSQANYAHDLDAKIIEQYGQLRIRQRSTGRPLARAYVKVYARTTLGTIADSAAGGRLEFYKDGYTDLRGAFDYASLSTDTLDRVQRFAILVMTDECGALIREAAPPQR